MAIYVKSSSSAATYVAMDRTDTAVTATNTYNCCSNGHLYKFSWSPSIRKLNLHIDGELLTTGDVPGGVVFCRNHGINFVWTGTHLQTYIDNQYVGDLV